MRPDYIKDWSEQIKYRDGILFLSAESFNKWVQSFMAALPWAKDIPEWRDPKKGDDKEANYLKVGDHFKICMRPFKEKRLVTHAEYGGLVPVFLARKLDKPYWTRNKLEMYRRGREVGQVCFDGDIKIPILCSGHGHTTWMSLTPSEIISQRAGLRKARGKVLIGGLGMGWFLRRVMERKQVSHVTVYETNADIIKWFGKAILRAPEYKCLADRVTFVRQDVWKAPMDEFDSVLLDIWEGAGHSMDDYQFRELARSHPNAWAWA